MLKFTRLHILKHRKRLGRRYTCFILRIAFRDKNDSIHSVTFTMYLYVGVLHNTNIQDFRTSSDSYPTSGVHTCCSWTPVT